MMSDDMLLLFLKIKWLDNSITCMVKPGPLMYDNVKKVLKYCVVKKLFNGPVYSLARIIVPFKRYM